jgi:copper chaperone CopZ
MKSAKFKTSINCINCVRSVSGFLNEVPGVEKWNVDTSDKDKILSVEGADFSETKVIEAVEEAGFTIEKY